MDSQSSLKTSKRGGGGRNPLNPPPESASATILYNITKLKRTFFWSITLIHLAFAHGRQIYSC